MKFRFYESTVSYILGVVNLYLDIFKINLITRLHISIILHYRFIKLNKYPFYCIRYYESIGG
jgi:hypothetical protein